MKKRKFWLCVALYLFLAFADGALTFLNTPDLSFEGNPLVAKFGLGWGALAIANISVFLVFFAAAYYSSFQYETVYTGETRFTRYWSQITFDRPDMFWQGLILFPKHWKPCFAALGFCVFPTGIAARLILVLEWLAITFHIPGRHYYFYLERKYCFGRLDIFAAVVVSFACIIYWVYAEFKKQLPQAKEAAGA